MKSKIGLACGTCVNSKTFMRKTYHSGCVGVTCNVIILFLSAFAFE